MSIINCEYYIKDSKGKGMCFYLNGKIAICEPCQCEEIPKKSIKEDIENCQNKRTIGILEKMIEETETLNI